MYSYLEMNSNTKTIIYYTYVIIYERDRTAHQVYNLFPTAMTTERLSFPWKVYLFHRRVDFNTYACWSLSTSRLSAGSVSRNLHLYNLEPRYSRLQVGDSIVRVYYNVVEFMFEIYIMYAV